MLHPYSSGYMITKNQFNYLKGGYYDENLYYRSFKTTEEFSFIGLWLEFKGAKKLLEYWNVN